MELHLCSRYILVGSSVTFGQLRLWKALKYWSFLYLFLTSFWTLVLPPTWTICKLLTSWTDHIDNRGQVQSFQKTLTLQLLLPEVTTSCSWASSQFVKIHSPGLRSFPQNFFHLPSVSTVVIHFSTWKTGISHPWRLRTRSILCSSYPRGRSPAQSTLAGLEPSREWTVPLSDPLSWAPRPCQPPAASQACNVMTYPDSDGSTDLPSLHSAMRSRKADKTKENGKKPLWNGFCHPAIKITL